MSEQSKHTPGPWRYTPEGFVIAGNGERICQTWNKYGVDFPNMTFRCPNAENNGPFIAAAPATAAEHDRYEQALLAILDEALSVGSDFGNHIIIALVRMALKGED